jgi:excinuclease ABC subunit C
MPSDLESKRDRLPTTSGVYLFKDTAGEVIYVGKAGNLRKRVSQYFTARDLSPKIEVLKKHIATIDYVETPTEADALIFEASLISEYTPKYNTRLKDDKSYPLLKLTREKYPRLSIARLKDFEKSTGTVSLRDRHGTYFGPYTDATLLREALRLIHAIFPIRKCKTLPKKACLYYRIKQCIAPCIHRDEKTAHDYACLINEITSFLGAGKRSLIAYLSERMQEESRALNFEQAAVIKKRIEALDNLRKKRFRVKRGAAIGLVATEELKRALGLKGDVERIICFDVSNIMGKWAVASKVSFQKELPDTSDYRHFKIKTVTGINDYDMVSEAVRRFARALKTKNDHERPDLIMIDGGKGHLSAALKVLRDEECDDLPVVAIAKRFEILFGANIDPVQFPPNSAALNLVKKIRDEAHRFAVDYHTHLRSRAVSKSVLDEIAGIGPHKKKALLRHFASVKEIMNADENELAAVPGLSRRLAKKIRETLRRTVT